MKVISPFGPKIAKLKFSSRLIKIINLEVNKIWIFEHPTQHLLGHRHCHDRRIW